MKVSLYFALRELRRRPRRTLSLILVSTAILTSLYMLLFYLEADWRSRVMPDTPSNYHFHVRTTEDPYEIRAYIKKQPWVQAWYEEDFYRSEEEYLYTQFSVRVDWEHLLVSSALAREMFDSLELWDSDYYADNWEFYYNDTYNKFIKQAYGASTINGVPIEVEAEYRAKLILINNMTRNASFCRLTINSYIIRPEFAVYMSLFSCFLGAATAIMFSEQYRHDMQEYGSLRALGLKRSQLVFISCIENLITTLMSIPLATAFTFILVRVYTAATKRLDDGSVYLNLSEHLPLGAMAVVAVMMLAVSLIGCIAVCLFYKNRTAMELLRGIESVRISFVSKTSPRFERASSLSVYDRLYTLRTRTSFLIGVLTVSLMMPLPLWFLAVVVSFFGMELSGGNRLIAIYHAVQTAMLFTTAVTVTFVSMRSGIESRFRELGILRALGVSKKRIKRSALTPPLLQSVIILPTAALLFLNLSDISVSVSSLPSPRNLNIVEEILKLAASAFGTAALIFPPLLAALKTANRRFFARSAIENLRETE